MEIVKSGSMIQSLQVGIKIVDVVKENEGPMSFSDIQEKTQITKSNLYKYMNTLVHLELLFRDKSTGLYHLGNKLIQYGMAAIRNEDTVALITPYLQSISQHSKCSALFATWSFDGPIVVKIWSAENVLNIGAQIGTVLPKQSSSGKIFQAFQKNNMKFRNQEENDLSEEEMIQIHKEKIAFAREPLISSVSSVSIPVLSYNEELIGSVTVVGFSDNIPTNVDEPLSQYLINQQKEVSKIFGHHA